MSKNSGTTESDVNQPLRNSSFLSELVLTTAHVAVRNSVKRRMNSDSGGRARHRNSTWSSADLLWRLIARSTADWCICSDARFAETSIHVTLPHIHSSSPGQLHHRQNNRLITMIATVSRIQSISGTWDKTRCEQCMRSHDADTHAMTTAENRGSRRPNGPRIVNGYDRRIPVSLAAYWMKSANVPRGSTAAAVLFGE